MAEQHDRNERGQLLPERHARKAERHGETEHERDGDGERDQRHHPGQTGAKLSDRSLDEWRPTVQEHRRPEHGGDPLRSRKCWCRVVKRPLEHVAPDERRNGQRERDPELVAEHRDAVAGVFVVPSVLTVGAIAGMRIGSHVPHLPHGGRDGGNDVVVMVRVAQMFGHAGSTAHSCPLLCRDMLLPPRLRKFALTAHVTASVGWLGAVAAFLAVAIAGLTSGDTPMVRAAYLAMGLTGWFVIVPLSLASLLTGLGQALGTTWGLFRHYWVLAKLLITVVATILLLVHMQP